MLCIMHTATSAINMSRLQQPTQLLGLKAMYIVHRYAGFAEPAPGDKLGFVQMYMYDSGHEAENCMISQLGVQLGSNLIALLQKELDGADVQMFRVFNISERDPLAYILLLSDTCVDCF